jgi:hypothetical protein
VVYLPAKKELRNPHLLTPTFFTPFHTDDGTPRRHGRDVQRRSCRDRESKEIASEERRGTGGIVYSEPLDFMKKNTDGSKVVFTGSK